MDWHATQNQQYLLLLERRLKEPRLMWVEQFVGIINNLINQLGFKKCFSINDFGCNVGHFYRGTQVINATINYCGFDISDTYLEIARKHFPDATFLNFDIAGDISPRIADITVISATLEHIANHESAIKNIFDTTKHLAIIRTFIGDNYICDSCLTDGANEDYLIKQFLIDDLVRYPKVLGWNAFLVPDAATDGKSKYVCNGRTIKRTQQIIVFNKNEK